VMPALCVALDSTDPERCTQIAARTATSADIFKVGLTSFLAGGRKLVQALARTRPVFFDHKLHDIPTQVAGATETVASLGARYITVHAAGGAEMIKASVAAGGDRLTVLAVTVLTSLDDVDLRRAGVAEPLRRHVERLADVALDAGAQGLVCSAGEAPALRERFGERGRGGPLLVVPGIRPGGSGDGDQRRSSTASAAVAAGADVLVVGRPITAAPDPAAAAAAFARAMQG
jgi:orotidine-5'-phosphate decarboxylase